VDGKGKVRGNPLHPFSRGDLCKKPLYRESLSEPFGEIDWQTAYTLLKERLTELSLRRCTFTSPVSSRRKPPT